MKFFDDKIKSLGSQILTHSNLTEEVLEALKKKRDIYKHLAATSGATSGDKLLNFLYNKQEILKDDIIRYFSDTEDISTKYMLALRSDLDSVKMIIQEVIKYFNI